MNVSIFIHLLFLQYFFLAENKMYHILNVICCKLIFLGAYRGNTDAQVMWRISLIYCTDIYFRIQRKSLFLKAPNMLS